MRKVRDVFGTLFLIGLAVVIIQSTVRELNFYYDKTVVAVRTTEDVQKLKDNMVAEISLPLDVKEAYWVQYKVSKREFQLIPFAGVGYRLMWLVEGEMTDREMRRLQPPFKGRVVEQSGSSWEVYGKRMKLEDLFAKGRIKLPANTMLLYDAPKKYPNAWQLFLFTGAIAYLLWKAYSLIRFVVGRKS